jgi:hypothetical protein
VPPPSHRFVAEASGLRRICRAPASYTSTDRWMPKQGSVRSRPSKPERRPAAALANAKPRGSRFHWRRSNQSGFGITPVPLPEAAADGLREERVKQRLPQGRLPQISSRFLPLTGRGRDCKSCDCSRKWGSTPRCRVLRCKRICRLRSAGYIDRAQDRTMGLHRI